MTLSTNRVRRGILVGAIVAALGVTALWFIDRTQIGPAAFGCTRYLENAASEDFRESLYNWARREFQNVPIQLSALPKGYRLSGGPGIVEAFGVSGLDFFPGSDRDLRVGLDIDSSGFVERVYVGRAPTRAGLIVFLRGESEKFRLRPAIVERFESVAVYCND
jgi:hypothetical protein